VRGGWLPSLHPNEICPDADFFPKGMIMPPLPIFFFFSGLAIGLLAGPVILRCLKAWLSTPPSHRGN